MPENTDTLEVISLIIFAPLASVKPKGACGGRCFRTVVRCRSQTTSALLGEGSSWRLVIARTGHDSALVLPPMVIHVPVSERNQPSPVVRAAGEVEECIIGHLHPKKGPADALGIHGTQEPHKGPASGPSTSPASGGIDFRPCTVRPFAHPLRDG